MKILLLLTLLISGINAGRDYHPICLLGDKISVYYDSLAVYEVCKLDNMRDHENLDWYYYTLVDGQTSNMFHIATCLMVNEIFESCTIQGWVNKTDCAVAMQVDKYVEGGNMLKYLYEKPDYSSPRTVVEFSDDCLLYPIYVEGVDLSPGSRWIKISLIYRGVRYCGWTERYYTD